MQKDGLNFMHLRKNRYMQLFIYIFERIFKALTQHKQRQGTGAINTSAWANIHDSYYFKVDDTPRLPISLLLSLRSNHGDYTQGSVLVQIKVFFPCTSKVHG